MASEYDELANREPPTKEEYEAWEANELSERLEIATRERAAFLDERNQVRVELAGLRAEIAGLRADCAALRDGLRRLSGEAFSLIVAERERQQSAEGWTPAHDDTHTNGALAQAASCYASVRAPREEDWPWESHWNKRAKHDRIRQLVIAGALIVAEIERLQRRAAGAVCSECGGEGVVAIESDSLLSAGTRVLAKCRSCNP